MALLKNKLLFFSFVAVCIGVVIFIIAVLFQSPQSSKQPIAEMQTAHVQPDETILLKPGQLQSFVITFTVPVKTQTINASLTSFAIAAEPTPTSIAITMSFAQQGKELTVTTQESIKPLHAYNLTIQDRQANKMLLNKSYISADFLPTPVAINNPKLEQYLPYETDSFRLIYLQERNIYIFNFKYNPNSTEDIQTQYEKAKQQAVNFIKSKGIDINTIVIEWRYS